MIGKEAGGYLTNLEREYELIAKRQPLFEKSAWIAKLTFENVSITDLERDRGCPVPS